MIGGRQSLGTAPGRLDVVAPPRFPARQVDSEHGVLEAVYLSRPDHLAMVPCNSVTRESLRLGYETSTLRAIDQHRAMARALTAAGVEIAFAPPHPDFPDQSFMRDSSLMTPWGLVGLRPGAFHRLLEAEHVLAEAAMRGLPVLGRVKRGTIEGGDICLLRPGVVLIGISGKRTNEEGAEALAEIFRAEGWEAILYHLDPHFLHLDTIFSVVDRTLALGCTDVLDDDFIARIEALGIEILPVSYKEARRLGCNILSLGDRRILASDENGRVNGALAERGYQVSELDISEFTRCGGGIHCLTMPLRRAAG